MMLAGKVKIYTAEDGTGAVPRYARHEWMLFDRPAHLLSRKQREFQEKWMEEQGEDIVQRLKNIEVVAEAWTEPKDGEKRDFLPELVFHGWRTAVERELAGRSVYGVAGYVCDAEVG